MKVSEKYQREIIEDFDNENTVGGYLALLVKWFSRLLLFLQDGELSNNWIKALEREISSKSESFEHQKVVYIMEESEKPPIGVKLIIEKRLDELEEAVLRYWRAGKEIPQEWHDESMRLDRRLQELGKSEKDIANIANEAYKAMITDQNIASLKRRKEKLKSYLMHHWKYGYDIPEEWIEENKQIIEKLQELGE